MENKNGCWFCDGEAKNFQNDGYEVSGCKDEMYIEDRYTHEAGTAVIEIKFCPFCGKELEK